MKNTDAVNKWVAALRSGHITQGYRELYSTKTCMCALGVAAHIAATEGVISPDWYYQADQKGCVCLEGPLSPVRDWLGLATDDGQYGPQEEKYGSILFLNDTERKSFLEIADLIESNPEGLFVREEI